MSITALIIYLLVAAICSVIAERLIGVGPWGLLGNIIVGAIGIWLMLNVLHFVLPGDPVVAGVPILTAILGAIIVDFLLYIIARGMGTRGAWRRRRV